MAVESKSYPGNLERERVLHQRSDPHGRVSRLADVILGGQDGLVNVLGIVLGVAVAYGDARVILTAGLAAAFAESVSMGAVAYTATLAEADFYESERDREHRHIRRYPNQEKEEIREIYNSKGFEGELLDQIVETITSDQEVWVRVMLAEEHHLSPVDRHSAKLTALIVGVSALVGSVIPLVPFLFLPVAVSVILALIVSALTLFIVGVYKARVTTIGRPARSGLEMALIGTLSALVGYGIGMLFRIAPGL
jgi:predicted membrane protein (TIGR00267 family)